MELNFVVDWCVPVVATSDGTPGRIIALMPYQRSFEVPYPGYKVLYQINRIERTIYQYPSVGGMFFGRCDLRPLHQKF